MESVLYNVHLSSPWKAREFLMSATRGQGSSFFECLLHPILSSVFVHDADCDWRRPHFVALMLYLALESN